MMAASNVDPLDVDQLAPEDQNSSVSTIPLNGTHLNKATQKVINFRDTFYLRSFCKQDLEKKSNLEWFLNFYGNKDHMQYVHARSVDYIKNYINHGFTTLNPSNCDEKECLVDKNGRLKKNKPQKGDKLNWIIVESSNSVNNNTNNNSNSDNKGKENDINGAKINNSDGNENDNNGNNGNMRDSFNYGGSCEIEIRDGNIGVFEILVDKSYGGRGLGTLTVLKLCQICFDILKCELIRGMIVVNNIGSIKAARACGLRPRCHNDDQLQPKMNGKIKKKNNDVGGDNDGNGGDNGNDKIDDSKENEKTIEVVSYELNGGMLQLLWGLVKCCQY